MMFTIIHEKDKWLNWLENDLALYMQWFHLSNVIINHHTASITTCINQKLFFINQILCHQVEFSAFNGIKSLKYIYTWKMKRLLSFNICNSVFTYICSLENLTNQNTRSAAKQYHKEHQQSGQGTSTCT